MNLVKVLEVDQGERTTLRIRICVQVKKQQLELHME